MRYYTADLHLGHTNIITYSARPYHSAHEMDTDLVARWNALITPDDEVWVLGDLALGRLEESLASALLLNGTKILVPGNHDRCWLGRKKGPASRGLYKAAGFHIVDNPEPITLAGFRVEIGHFPFRATESALGLADSYVDKFSAFRPVSRGQWLLHGHVHEKWRCRGRALNVGVDAWGGVPVAESTLADLIAAGPADLAPLPWDRS